jgi:hypothetical protein
MMETVSNSLAEPETVQKPAYRSAAIFGFNFRGAKFCASEINLP